MLLRGTSGPCRGEIVGRTRGPHGALRPLTLKMGEPIVLGKRHVSVNTMNCDPAECEPSTTGDRFASFFRCEHPRAVRLAWMLTRSQEAAEDIAQEGLLATHARFEELDEPAAFLTRVIVNQCHTWTRRASAQRRLLRSLSPEVSAPDSTSDVALLDAVTRLPYRQQVVVITRYWGGWSEKEIAVALECRPGTVKSLASRALAQLEKELNR